MAIFSQSSSRSNHFTVELLKFILKCAILQQREYANCDKYEYPAIKMAGLTVKELIHLLPYLVFHYNVSTAFLLGDGTSEEMREELVYMKFRCSLRTSGGLMICNSPHTKVLRCFNDVYIKMQLKESFNRSRLH